MTINTALHQRVSTFSERCLGYQDGPAREPWLLQWSELRLVHLRFPRHSVFFFSVWIFWKFSFSVWDLLELPVSPVVSEHFFFRDLCNRSWFQPPNGIMASVKLECPKTGQQHLCFFLRQSHSDPLPPNCYLMLLMPSCLLVVPQIFLIFTLQVRTLCPPTLVDGI